MNFKHGCAVKTGRDKSNPQWRAHYVWLSMRARCQNPKHKSYNDYGARGITIDPAWSDFSAFFADMGPAPSLSHSIERINNDGPYSRANCKWATRLEQNRNKRTNHYLEYKGQRRIISEWAEQLGVASRLLRVRLNRGWSVEKTLSTPVSS